MNKQYYTGIGSRQADETVCSAMTETAKLLDSCGYTLRSGGADGADLAFEKGALNKEIWVPWKGFNSNESNLTPSKEAFDIAKTVHPVWFKLSQAAQKLHARNCHQVLGNDLKTPSLFLLCWTPDGKITGGSATAINLAIRYNIPVFNYATVTDGDYINAVKDFLLIIGENDEL